MTVRSSTYLHDPSVDAGFGLGPGAGLPGIRVETFAEAEMRYREQRWLAEARRSEQQNRHRNSRRNQNRRGLVSRWTTWLPSALVHRSSVEPQSSNVCGS